VTGTPYGARVIVKKGGPPAVQLARELLPVVTAFRRPSGGRLSVGIGVSTCPDAYSGLEAVSQRAELAATESLNARDHVVVVAEWPGDPGPHRRALNVLRRTYQRVRNSRRPVWLLAWSTAIGVVPPFLLYCVAGALGFNLGGLVYWVVFGALAMTALVNYSEAFTAFDPPRLPDEPEQWPSLTVVVSAYLPNEVDVIVGTTEELLSHGYPGSLQVIVAYNGPPVPLVETQLAALAESDPRLVVLAVNDSTSKAQNVNAALDLAEGDIVGLFDADHRPAPGSLGRAACWLAEGSGVDVVQGHCSVRNGEDGWLQQMVAVEFEAIYAVGHPGRAGLHQFGIFGGSNGFWRTDLLRKLRLRPRMLTEDIDASMRALLGGARLVCDPGLVSYELAPTTGRALWSQRTRWSQGWSQVSRRYWRQLATSPILSGRQRIGALWLTVWRDSYAWLSVQMFPSIAYLVLVRHQKHIHWMLLFFSVSTLFTSAVGPIQSLFARRLAVPHLRHRRSWWWAYLLVWGAPYGEWRTAVCRAAHLREALGDQGWIVTPRSAAREIVAFTGRSSLERKASA
jgi:cellulose synthase/poly-beta-1,6-N-acetylglucosamine synthase-like glycosyltransferase